MKNKKLSGSEVTFDRLAWTDPFELTLFSLLAENLILTTYIVEIEKCNKDNNLNSVGIYWCCRKKVFPYLNCRFSPLTCSTFGNVLFTENAH